MATAKTVKVKVGGMPIAPYHVTIHQRSDWHHRFEVAVSTEKIEENISAIAIATSLSYIGKGTEISVERAGKKLGFKGVITTVHLDRTFAGDSLVILSGYSPTYLMEDGISTKSYAEKNIAAIFDEVTKSYDKSLLKTEVKPAYTKPIPYIVQYKETNYHFISRIAAKYGEWFYYDGKKVVFGKPSNPPHTDLTLGKDLDSFDYGVQLRPSKFKYQSYNYKENQVLEKSSKSFKPQLDTFAKKALDIADKIFVGEPTTPTLFDVTDINALEHLVHTRKASLLSNTSFFNGQSTNPGVKVGGRIRARVVNKIFGQNITVLIGNFRIINVVHHVDANKDYWNQFEAIPLIVTAPPINKNIVKPEAESQIAVVEKNEDPDSMGRVRVKFSWQTESDMVTPWIRVATPHAGKGDQGSYGLYFVPEVDDEVYVDFEQGNPDRPYVTASKYHSKVPPEWGANQNDNNNLKAIKTRTGHTVLFDDKDGSEKITIKDKSGNSIVLNTANSSISISAPDTISLSATDIKLNASNSISMKADPSNSSDNNSGGSGTIDMTAKEDIKVESTTKDIAIDAKAQNVKITSLQNYEVKATQKVVIEGTAGVEISSPATTKVEGTASVKVSGAAAEVKGTGTLNLEAGTLNTIKGMPVKIN